MVYELIDHFEIAAPVADVWEAMCVPENLGKITPKWMAMKVRSPKPVTVEVGKRIDYSMAWQGIPLRWSSLITEHEKHLRISYIQLKGPYAFWLHDHHFEDHGDRTVVRDRCLYSVHLGPVGRMIHWAAVRHQVMDIFKTRRRKLHTRVGKLRGIKGPIIRYIG